MISLKIVQIKYDEKYRVFEIEYEIHILKCISDTKYV